MQSIHVVERVAKLLGGGGGGGGGRMRDGLDEGKGRTAERRMLLRRTGKRS